MSLHGRKVLVVRPRPIAGLGEDQFIEQLMAVGAEPLHYPVISVVPLAVPSADMPSNFVPRSPEVELIRQRVLDLTNYTAAIFVSRPAAYLGAQWINHCRTQLSAITRSVTSKSVTTKFYAVGSSTAAMLAKQGIDAITPQQTLDSEGLLTLPGLQRLDCQKVLIFRGCGGRELLTETLHDRGATVHCAELYRRQRLDEYQQQISEALQGGLNAVVVHSGELLQALLALLPERLHGNLRTVPLLVPGQRLQRMAQRAGFQNIVVSTSALPQNMVSALSRWYINAN